MRTAAVLLLLPLGALAANPKVVVLPFTAGEGATEVAAGKFTTLLTDELKSRDDSVDLVAAPAAAKPSPKAQAAAARNEKAVAALENGKKAVEALEFEAGLVELKKGLDGAFADPATMDFQQVIEAEVALAVAAFRLGNQKETSNALAVVARLDPEHSLGSGYPPVFTRELEKAKHKIAKLPRASLSIDGPSGSIAFLDGKQLGAVPQTAENLPSGPHWVKVEGPQGERFGQSLELKSGLSKVKAVFAGGGGGGGGEGGVAEPRLAAAVDASTVQRIGTWVQAAGAEFALVGLVYRTGEQQLTAGLAVYNAQTRGLAPLPAMPFDAEVLTANVEAFRLADELQKRTDGWPGNAALPLLLVTKPVYSKSGSGPSIVVSDVTVVTPERRAVRPRDVEKTELTPAPREIPGGNQVVDATEPVPPEPPGEIKKGIPTWVWIVAGVGVAAGAGVGGYFAISNATKPVTGTVTASW